MAGHPVSKLDLMKLTCGLVGMNHLEKDANAVKG
jgi:hypothetical protein